MKVMKICLGVTFALMAVSCSKSPFESGMAGKKVAYFTLNSGSAADSKVSIDNGTGVLTFSESDRVKYYSAPSGGTGSSSDSYVVPSAGGTVTVPVTYNDREEDVVFFFPGTSIGGISGTPSVSSMTLTDGVPALQDGNFSCCHLEVAKASIASPTATLKPVQGLISFKLDDLSFGGREVEKIAITAAGNTNKDNKYICGDLTIGNPGTGNTLTYGSGTEVIVDRRFEKFVEGQVYYAALNAVSYINGLMFTAYDGSDNVIGKVFVDGASDFLEVAAGKTLNIGNLKNKYKSVPLNQTVEPIQIYPSVSYTTYELGKMIWVRYYPEDYSGTVSVSCTPDILDVTDITSTLSSTSPGSGVGNCKVYKATLKSSTITAHPIDEDDNTHDELSCEITFTFENPTGYTGTEPTAKCKITFGDLIDLGLYTADGRKCLWFRSSLTGTVGSWGLCSDGFEQSFYEWGSTINTMWTPKSNYWGGWWIGGNGVYWSKEDYPNTKYCRADGLTELQYYSGQYAGKTSYDTVDDLFSLWKGDTTYRVPSCFDCSVLMGGTSYEVLHTIGTTGADQGRRTSTIMGYTDMYVDLGECYHYTSTTKRDGHPGCATREVVAPQPGRAYFFDGDRIIFNSKDKVFNYRGVRYVKVEE